MALLGRLRRNRVVTLLAALTIGAIACGEPRPEMRSAEVTPGDPIDNDGDGDQVADPPDPSPGETTPSSVPSAGDATLCGPFDTTSAGRLERAEVTEASGLAASSRHRGVLWTHNDSGGAAGVYAFDLDGRDLGFFALVDGGEPVTLVDTEDLAIVDGTLYLADIGDHGRRRSSVAIHLFEEPTRVGADGTVETSRVVEVRYPEGPTDAEALLVDPVTGELVLLSKDSEDKSGPTRIYTVDPSAAEDDGTPGRGGEPIEATLAGTVDVAALTRSSTAGDLNPAALLFPGAVTGADVSPAGDLIAIRTYGSVWLFDRTPGQSLVAALQGPACEGGAAAEGQGEAVAILPPSRNSGDDPGSVEYVTVGEGRAPPVNVQRVELGR